MAQPYAGTNTTKTNKLTDLVALRFLVAAGFVTVGSKEHFKDQMVGKRNGQTYKFVFRDAVEVGEGLAVDNTVHSNNGPQRNLIEREIEMSLRDFHAVLDTNAVEAVTDVNWDTEIAEPNGGKIANYVVRKAVNEAFLKPTVAVWGSGFQPLAEVAAYLGSISNEKMFGFVDPRIQAILTANGQQFNPVGSPDSFYKQGLLGTFHNVEYRGQRFMPSVVISDALANAFVGATLASASAIDTTNKRITIKLAAASTVVVPKGTPIKVQGVFATDLIGDPTDQEYTFIVKAQHNTAGTSTRTYELDVEDIPAVEGLGAREVAVDIDACMALTDFNSKPVEIPPAGRYYSAQVRLDGTYEFCTLDKLDASNSESKLGKVEGITVHENRIVNVEKMQNTTRWDIVAMFGVVERRGTVNVYIKA